MSKRCTCRSSDAVLRNGAAAVRAQAVILPVVLFILILLGLLAAGFSFMVHADVASMRVLDDRLQTRLAAEAGLERVKLLLRDERFDVTAWYDNPEELHRIVVWSSDEDGTVWGTNEELDDGITAYRYSVVADDPTDDEEFIRFGVTDEASKLNLNTATEQQLRRLIGFVAADDPEINVPWIVDAILDWRDADTNPRGEQADTELEYYQNLDPPYRVKNGPLETVEELLLVKNVTGQILYGEDFDRNGLLTPNEDDGDETFPADNQDGELNRGIYPYLTVMSYEADVANDRRPRASLVGDENVLRTELTAAFPDDPQVVDYVITKAKDLAQQGENNSPTGGNGGPTGRSASMTFGQEGAGEGEEEIDIEEIRRIFEEQAEKESGNQKGSERLQQSIGEEDGEENADNENDNVEQGDNENDNTEESSDNENENDNASDNENENDNESEEEEGQAGPPPGLNSPADLFADFEDAASGSPLTLEHLPILMDRTTVRSQEQMQRVEGLININTAAPEVLRLLTPLTGEQVASIVDLRTQLDGETLATTAWLVTEGVLDMDTYRQIAPKVTARGQQFRVEVLGYADHMGMVTRLEAVIDMVGPLAQVIYYRDISELGARFPIREEDLENIRVRR